MLRGSPTALRLEDWTSEQKLRAVTEPAALSERELGGPSAARGSHEAQLGEWRKAALEALGGPAKPGHGTARRGAFGSWRGSCGARTRRWPMRRHPGAPKSPRELVAARPNQVWRWDITYLKSAAAKRPS